MKDILQDVVAHTHQLGFLSLVKVTNEEKTKIESMAEDRSVILSATTNKKVSEFTGTFGIVSIFIADDSSQIKERIGWALIYSIIALILMFIINLVVRMLEISNMNIIK